jgi:hypothetical protein
MKRAIALSMLVLFSIAVIIPIMDSSAHNDRRHFGHRKHHHSRAWWRRYHARKRRQRRMARLRMRNLQPVKNGLADAAKPEVLAHHVTAESGLYLDPSGRWSVTLPAGWNSRTAPSNGEVKFRIFAADGKPAGYSALAGVNVPASPKPMLASKARRYIGDVSFSDLRKTVIDKMIVSNGWVTNDYERTIDGKRVFVVVAQTGNSPDGSVGPQSWSFYFTEVDGKVYSLSTTAPVEFFDQADSGSQQLLGSFKGTTRPTASLPPSER